MHVSAFFPDLHVTGRAIRRLRHDPLLWRMSPAALAMPRSLSDRVRDGRRQWARPRRGRGLLVTGKQRYAVAHPNDQVHVDPALLVDEFDVPAGHLHVQRWWPSCAIASAAAVSGSSASILAAAAAAAAWKRLSSRILRRAAAILAGGDFAASMIPAPRSVTRVALRC